MWISAKKRERGSKSITFLLWLGSLHTSVCHPIFSVHFLQSSGCSSPHKFWTFTTKLLPRRGPHFMSWGASRIEVNEPKSGWHLSRVSNGEWRLHCFCYMLFPFLQITVDRWQKAHAKSRRVICVVKQCLRLIANNGFGISSLPFVHLIHYSPAGVLANLLNPNYRNSTWRGSPQPDHFSN